MQCNKKIDRVHAYSTTKAVMSEMSRPPTLKLAKAQQLVDLSHCAYAQRDLSRSRAHVKHISKTCRGDRIRPCVANHAISPNLLLLHSKLSLL